MIINIYTCILLFFLYSFLGWVMEVTLKYIELKRFINRGFLIGPYCPIYGCGAVLITLLLQKFVNDPITLFLWRSSLMQDGGIIVQKNSILMAEFV